MEKRQIILPEKRYEKASSEELEVQVILDEKKSLLTNDDRDIVVDVNDVFNQERNKSLNYKIYGKLRMIFRNMYSGSSDYDYLSNKLCLLGDGTGVETIGYLPYNEFAFLRNDICREEILNNRVKNLSNFTGFTQTITGTTGSTNHHIITAITAPHFNWNIYLSYVYAQDNNYPMKYTLSGNTTPLSFVSGDGIPFRVIDEGKSYKLTSPVDHGMSEGEYVIISGYPFYINSIGDELYDSENYVISILKSQVPLTETVLNENILVTGKRCLDNNNMSGTTSQYYIHKHKVVTRDEDYIIDKSGFESPIWEDERKILFEIGDRNDVIVERNRMEAILYDFKTSFVLSGITNNFGYTPTEAYVSVVFRNTNGYFNYPPKVGYKFNFHNEWIDKQFDGTTSNEDSMECVEFTKDSLIFYEGQPLTIGDDLTGAFVEYNPTEMKERIVSESFHKFTCNDDVFNHNQDQDVDGFSGATPTNKFGLYYQPHYRVKLRELSPYIETSDSPDIDSLPENAKYYPDEKLWKWRDLYDHGYMDDLDYGVNHPFMNGNHYVKNDINFYLRNEKLYKNKSDGIFDFNSFFDKKKNNSKDKINC